MLEHVPHVRASLQAAKAAYAARGFTPAPPSDGTSPAQKHAAPLDSENGVAHERSFTQLAFVRQTAQAPVHSCATHVLHAFVVASAALAS